MTIAIRTATLLALVAVGAWCWALKADVRSDNGTIRLDVNGDSAVEAAFTNTGLGIGTASPSTNLHVLGNAFFQSSNLGVGTATPKNTLDVTGSLGFNTQSVTSNVTLSGNSMILVSTASDNITVTLPYAGNVSGRHYTIKKTSNSNRLVVGGGGNLIDSLSNIQLVSSANGYPGLNVISNGQQWYVTGVSGNVADYASAATAVSSNLVGWWKFNETSGNSAADSSGSGLTGTLKGAFTLTSNGYLNFAGTTGTDRVEVTNTSSLNTTVLTVTAWVNADAFTVDDGVHPAIIAKEVNANIGHFALECSGTGTSTSRLIFYHTAAENKLETNADTMSTGTWYNVGFAVSGTSYSFYRNGTDVGNSTLTALTSEDTKLVIGASGTGLSGSWDGLIDNVRIYNRKLSTAEMQTIYNEGRQQ